MINKRKTSQGDAILLHILVSLIFAFFTGALIISFFSYLMCNIDIPLFMAVPFATIAVAVASLVAAAIMAYCENGKGVLFGLGSGLVMFAVLWLCSAFNGEIGLTGLAILKLIAFSAAGCIGGIFGSFLKEKKLRHHH